MVSERPIQETQSTTAQTTRATNSSFGKQRGDDNHSRRSNIANHDARRIGLSKEISRRRP